MSLKEKKTHGKLRKRGRAIFLSAFGKLIRKEREERNKINYIKYFSSDSLPVMIRKEKGYTKSEKGENYLRKIIKNANFSRRPKIFLYGTKIFKVNTRLLLEKYLSKSI